MTLPHELLGVGFSAGQASNFGGGSNTSLAAAGSAQTDATVVKASFNIVTGADGTVGVRLPATQPGASVTIFNNSASTLKVYGATGAAISVAGTGLGTANSAFSHLTYKNVRYDMISVTQWLANVSA